jgi:hypothetical protein
MVYRLIAKDTIEEKVMALTARKAAAVYRPVWAVSRPDFTAAANAS